MGGVMVSCAVACRHALQPTGDIGLAIAQALVRAGTNVMLNGLGDREEIEALRRELAAESGV
jgi:3-hydroxybutyrate dehydrogenase